MRYIATIILLFALLFSFLSSENIVSAKTPVGGVERDYYFRIELSQWSIKLYDMNQIENLILQGISKDNAIKQSEYIESIGPLEKGSRVYLEIYSLDVRHGFSINDLDIVITAVNPMTEYNLPTLVNFDLPDKDVSLSAFCHVFCGLGHANMKLKFIVGKGSPENGKIIYQAFIGLNLLIFVIMVRTVLNSQSTSSKK